MSFKPYPKYKESGVEWLGRVPEHWEVTRLGYLASRIGSGKTPSGGADNYCQQGVLFLRSQNIYDEGLRLEDVVYITQATDEGMTTSRVLPGDILLNITGASLGRTCVVPDDFEAANVNQHVCVIRLRDASLRAFLSLLLKSAGVKSQLDYIQNGAAREGLNFSMVSSILCPLPSPEERDRIATFLDHETAKIDALIAEQQRLIELLQEKRQAVISHAVTKGLNPDAPMKDSGIEWLGEVPEHWEIGRGRFLYSQLEIPPEPDDGVVTAFRDGQVTLRSNRRTEGFTFAVLEVGYQRVREGDLVIHGMDAFAGAIGVSESTGKCTPEYAVLEPFQQGICSAYFAKVLRLMAHRNFIYVICPSVRERAPRFRFESFKDVLLPVPPEAEQHAIIQYVASQEQAMNSLAVEADLARALLKERRSALISAAVTGQIDVRSFAGTEAA